MFQYNEKLSDWYEDDEIDCLMTVNEFKENCKVGALIDYDGSGHPVKNDKININIYIYPSRLNEIPDDATHVLWFNK